MNEAPLSPKVARACLEVAREDKKRVKERPFVGEPPKGNWETSEWWNEEQERRLAACDARILHYKELASKK